MNTRPETVTIRRTKKLKQIGCHKVNIGVEHGNQKFRRDVVGRNYENELAIKAFDIMYNEKIATTCNNIIGYPDETRELVFDTIELARKLKSENVNGFTFVPYHGTVLREDAIKEGWLDPERQTTSVISESILAMPKPYLNSKEILGLVKTLPLYARFPKSRYTEIRQAENEEPGGPIFQKLRDEWYEMTYGSSEAERNLTYQG